MKSPTSVKKILASNAYAADLLRQVDTLQSLNARLQQLLPTPLAQHCTIAACKQGRLTILVSSSAWATRLRLLYPKITKAFDDFRINSVITQVAPAAAERPQQSIGRRRPSLSQQTAKLLIELAETTSDPKLKSALRRLSQHGGKQA